MKPCTSLVVGVWLGVFGALSPMAVAEPPTGCSFGTPAPDAPAQMKQFAFLIGHHEVTLHGWTGDAWTPPRPRNARWNGWYGLNGEAIYDEWIDAHPDTGALGVNVRMYDPAEDVWKMMWISTRARKVDDLRAVMIDGVLTMWDTAASRANWKAEFEILGPDRWARTSFLKNDDGSWRPEFRLVATRQACNSGGG